VSGGTLVANTTVTLLRKCKTPEGWRYYPVVMSANGKVKPNTVVVDGIEVAYPVGHYVLRSYAGDKIIWTRVKGGATEALEELRVAQKRANAVAVAASAGVQVVLDPQRVSLRKAVDTYIKEVRSRKALVAAAAYEFTLNEFLDGCSKTYADELAPEDITKFHGQMQRRGLTDRTVHNRHQHIRSFLLYLELDAKKIAGKAPRITKTMPEIYEPEDLVAFFASLTTLFDKLLFTLLLQSGLREQEAVYLEWIDISYDRKTLQVRSKPRYKHTIKDYEERELTLSKKLIAHLRAYRKQIPEEYRLVFGRQGGRLDQPDSHFLRRLKVLVRDAGLNCDVCKPCVENGECEKWFLHKFRATYATTLLRSGLDLSTVQGLMGHKDLASTMRYLRPASTAQVQDHVDAVKWY
jgi:integrase